jgi:hypothetical protein
MHSNVDSSERQLSIQVQLNDFQSQVQKQSLDAMKQLTNLRNDVLETMENTLHQVPPMAPPPYEHSHGGSAERARANGETEQHLSEQLRLIQGVRATLDVLLQSKNESSPEMRILKQLYFESLYSREEAMEKAGNDTFEWILEEEPAEASDAMDKTTKEARFRATSRFLKWLRSGNRLFHISGKAGSGKSTLMKLLLDHEKTKRELNHWAGNKQLVFAHFFFWRSGGELQRSLEGLYRSILFEILIQSPDLIREVFPKAYSAFSKTRQEDSIDKLFFRLGDFKKAFEDLVSRSPHPGYRFCLFIDGLDEYGGDDIDDLEHQKLADRLNNWASKDDIKILASSRPHRQFENTFSDDLRIRLHELTRYDIVLFGRNMFEQDKTFERPEVQARYTDLVEKVTASSDGVFLWARLAIRALLNSIGRYDPIDSLEQQLEGIPKDFNKLYEKLFASINPADRAKAFKMLLLVAENPTSNQLNALNITWLNDLEDLEFPTKCKFEPYTEEEIKRRHLEAECQLDGLTKGLLELTTWTNSYHGPDLFSEKRVQFFHRTVRDFVRQSKVIQEFSARFPDFTSVETYARLLLAELCFARSQALTGRIYTDILSRHEYRSSRDGLLDAYWRAFDHHNKADMEWPVFCSLLMDPNHIRGAGNKLAGSFLHWVAKQDQDAGYVQSKVAANPELLQPQGELSLLLSATIGWNGCTTFKALLDSGASPHDRVRIMKDEYSEFTVWQIFCAFFASRLVGNDTRNEFLRRECEILQYFLKAGVDPNCFVLLARSNERLARKFTGSPTHVISLKNLVQQLNPPNLEELSTLMEGRGHGIRGILGAAWRYLTSTNSSGKDSNSFRPEDYAPFSLDMGTDAVEDDSGTNFQDSDSGEGSGAENQSQFVVHSVQCGGTRVDALKMEIRYC